LDPAGGIACVIVKHNNPCGVAIRPHAEEAFRAALACDPLSAFGGVIAFNATVDSATAVAVGEQFYEGVAAPAFAPAALEALAKKKNLRVLGVAAMPGPAAIEGNDLRRVAGGLLVQTWDRSAESMASAKVVTRRKPTSDELA